jgi:hypothetical protein
MANFHSFGFAAVVLCWAAQLQAEKIKAKNNLEYSFID